MGIPGIDKQVRALCGALTQLSESLNDGILREHLVCDDYSVVSVTFSA
jgi:hypothetical protein